MQKPKLSRRARGGGGQDSTMGGPMPHASLNEALGDCLYIRAVTRNLTRRRRDCLCHSVGCGRQDCLCRSV